MGSTPIPSMYLIINDQWKPIVVTKLTDTLIKLANNYDIEIIRSNNDTFEKYTLGEWFSMQINDKVYGE